MTIFAKFASTCTACKTAIAPGTAVIWTRGVQGVKHASLDACRTAAAHRQTAAAVARPVISLSGLVSFLRAAKEGRNGGKPLKFPKVAFAAPGNGEVVISLSPDSGKNPGAVYVKLNGEYAGKVTADGVAYGLDALLPTLQAIEADPAGAGAAYGALRGHCSFCQTKLDDEGSLAVGYGPTCAKNYGLPHKPKGRAKTVPVVHAEVAPVAAPVADDKAAAWAKVADAAYDAQFPVSGPQATICRDCGDFHAPGYCDSL